MRNFNFHVFIVAGGSGGPFITGWIVSLFPYIDENKPNHYVWSENSSFKDTLKVF